MDFIKETVLEKLTQHGHSLRQEGLDPEMGEPSQELKDFCKTVYSSHYASPRVEEKFCKSIKEENTTYTMLSGVECAYGGRWPYYLYRIEQSGPTEGDNYDYWHNCQSCTWESRNIWSEEEGWEQEEAINIGRLSWRVHGQEYVPSCVPGLFKPKYPSHYDDRVELKYPYSRKSVGDRLGGTPYDFAFLWVLMVNRGSILALKVLQAQHKAAQRNAKPEWQEIKKIAHNLGPQGKQKIQRLVKEFLTRER